MGGDPRSSWIFHARRWSGRIIYDGLLPSGIGLSDARFNQQQRVVNLNLRIAELETLKGVAVLTVGGTEEIAAGCAGDNGLFQRRPLFRG